MLNSYRIVWTMCICLGFFRRFTKRVYVSLPNEEVSTVFHTHIFKNNYSQFLTCPCGWLQFHELTSGSPWLYTMCINSGNYFKFLPFFPTHISCKSGGSYSVFLVRCCLQTGRHRQVWSRTYKSMFVWLKESILLNKIEVILLMFFSSVRGQDFWWRF